MKAMRIGILTGGGDCPGLNAVIRAVVLGGTRHGDAFVGMLDGWLGAIENNTVPLDPDQCRSILTKGGTILGSSRTNPFATDDGPDRLEATMAALGLDAMVAIGGDDTLGAADRLYQRGLPVVGVPKTIDNDLSGTEVTFGFDTAVQIATDAIDRLQTTAESHHPPSVIVCSSAITGTGTSPPSSWPKGPFPETMRPRGSTARSSRAEPTSSVTSDWVASGATWPRRSSTERGSRPARPSLGTFSGAAPRPHSIACWPRGSAPPPLPPLTTVRSGRWWRCKAGPSSGSRCPMPSGSRSG
jgi:hypothetical protein